MKTLLTTLLLALVMNGFTQTWHIAGMGTTTNMYRNASWAGSGYAGSNHKVQVRITTSGAFSATNVYILYAGKKYYNNSWLTFNPGNYSLATYWSTPSNAPCGATGFVSISFYELGVGSLYSGTGAIYIVTPTLTDNTNFCNSSQNTFTLNFPTGNTNSIIAISKPGWLINGQVSPVTITGTQFLISPPSFSDAATLTISGNNYCAPIVKELIHSLSLPDNPSDLTYSTINNQSCYYNVSTPLVSGANYYEWADNSGFIFADVTTDNHTQFASGVEFEQGRSLQIWVRARNGCGLSTNSFTSTLDFPLLPNCLPSKSKPFTENGAGMESKNETVSTDNFSAYFLNSSNVLFLELPSGHKLADVSCFGIDGKLVYKFKVNSTISENNIPISSRYKLLILLINVEGKRLVKKISR